jgi:hypothetical protein
VKTCLAIHSFVTASGIVLAVLFSPFWLTPDATLVARMQHQARSGEVLGELALRHWAEEADPLARRAYVELLGERGDLESEADRVRFLRTAAITGDGAAAMQLAGLSYRMRLAGRGHASIDQIAHWYRQGRKAGVPADASVLSAIDVAHRPARADSAG